MKQEETKYTFVYNEIKQRILSGQIPYGKWSSLFKNAL